MERTESLYIALLSRLEPSHNSVAIRLVSNGSIFSNAFAIAPCHSPKGHVGNNNDI